MMMLLSDGRPVPVSLQSWTLEMRDCLIRLQVQPRLADVGDLRKLLACRPVHYLGSTWEVVIEQAGRWIDQAERGLSPLPFAALALAQSAAPLVADDHGPVGCPA
ncbi:MAG: hypothetical protein KGQ52_13305 [Alphaproteobacteria bacterium]|nr:hypothetical protein [Alphaproteobacteria bacterium]